MQRLLDFLDEIEAIGFYDQHITPLTSLMASSPVQKATSLIFDIGRMQDVGRVLGEHTGNSWQPTEALLTSMSTNKVQGQDEMQWIVKWKELVESKLPVAAKALRKLCDLYEL